MERPTDWKDVAPEANTLLESAFAREGGRSEALYLSKTGLKGGVMYVLSRMTEQYRRQRQKEYVDAVVAEAVDPLDWDSRVALVQEFLTSHGQMLAPDLASQPAARYVDTFPELLQAYVAATDHVNFAMRSA